jgi:hypothetical protein
VAPLLTVKVDGRQLLRASKPRVKVSDRYEHINSTA